jgi:hypothetical protein
MGVLCVVFVFSNRSSFGCHLDTHPFLDQEITKVFAESTLRKLGSSVIMGQTYRPQFAPLQPSNLRFQWAPRSPASPLTPQCLTAPSPPNTSIDHGSPCSPTSDPPPPLPIPWIWSCHRCRMAYPLGVTRRCLDDGHFLCVGDTVTPEGRVQRHNACHTEFDYDQWAVWGRWRRNKTRDGTVSTYTVKHCWYQCDFPSQCFHSPIVPSEKPEQSRVWSWSREDVDRRAMTSSPHKPSGLNLNQPGAAAQLRPPLLSPVEEESLESIAPPTSNNSLGIAGLGITMPDFTAFRASYAPTGSLTR